jgi:hypothetical protein
MSNYLDGLSDETREALLRPSKGLLRLQAFRDEYRKTKPRASMEEIQEAYVIREAKSI